MTDLGKLIAVLGAVLLVVGLIVMALGRTGLPIGRLPGDIVYRGKNTTVYFPIVTSIVLSVLLSGLLYLVNRLR
jgi:ABC-type Na+ efflux pump permease subunit